MATMEPRDNGPTELQLRQEEENEKKKIEDKALRQEVSSGNFDIRTATHLPNGAEILRRNFDGEMIVVSCDYGEEHTARYVTWHLDKDGNAYWGHYFRELRIANRDFTERVMALLEAQK